MVSKTKNKQKLIQVDVIRKLAINETKLTSSR